MNRAEMPGCRSKNATTENDLLRVKQADKIGNGHAPKLDGLGNDDSSYRVASIESYENIMGSGWLAEYR